MRASVQDDRLRAADRDARAVFAEAQALPGAVAPDDGNGQWPGHRTPGCGVEEPERAVVVEDGERAVVGAEGDGGQAVAVAAQHTDGRRALEQRRQQAAARLRRVVQRHALTGEQQGAVEVVLRERLRPEPLRRGRGRFGARIAALVERDQTGDHRDDQQRGHAREHQAPPALLAPARAPAVVQERALGRAELGLVPGRPLERGREARAAVEPVRVATVGVPGARRGAEPAMQPASLHVLLEPGSQPRPFAQQRLVPDLDRAVADRQQPAIGEPGDDLGDLLALELCQPDPAAHDRAALVLVGEAQQQPARRCLLAGIELEERVVGQPRDRALDAAAARIRGQAQARPVAPAPELQQRRGQQRQGARPALDVGQQRLDELGLDAQADPLRGALDRAPQLVARHRSDEHVVGAEQARELRVGGAAAVEVGAHGQHHDAVFIARDTHKPGDELGSLRLVRAGGEQLLELVDRQDTAPFAREPAGCAAKLAQRPLARPDQRLRPAIAPRQHAAREGGQQPSPQHRRLAAPGRSDDGEQRCVGHARDQLGDQPLAPEEVLGVGGVERRDALVRADRRGDVAVGADQAGALASRLELDEPACELLLQRARLAAVGRCAPGHRVDAACGLASRPLRGGLVNLPCDPAARGQQRLDGHRLRVGRGITGGDRPDAGGVERLEHERLIRLQSCECGGLLPRGQHEHRQATERRREIAQRRPHHGGRAVGIVDHDQHRPPRLARPGDRRQRSLRRTAPGGVNESRGLEMRLARNLRGQTRLAHPIRAGNGHQRARTSRRARPARPQPVQLALAPDQRRRRGRVELARKLRRHRLDVQRQVLAQDRVVQAPQLRRLLDADLLDQRLPGVAIGLKRVDLTPAPVEREHLPRVQPLTLRVLGQQRVDLADDLVMPARGQIRVDRQLRGGQAQLLEPTDLRGRERLVRHVCQRNTAKQRQRLARRPVRGLARLGRFGDQPFETADVHELAVDPQLIPTLAREELGAAVPAQHAAQSPDVVVDHARGARRWPLTPQPLDQPIGRHRTIRLEPQHRQNGALLRVAKRDGAAANASLDGSKDAEPHTAPRVRVLVHGQPNHIPEPPARASGRGVHTLPKAALRPVYDAVYGAD